MGQIWSAAKRGEGYDLAREHEGFTWFLIVILSIGHTINRFCTGKPMGGDQHRKTNAEWAVPGTRLIHPNARTPFRWNSKDRTYCWSALTERRRAAIRFGALIVAIAIPWVWFTLPYYGYPLAAAAIALPVTLFNGRIVNTLAERKHRQEIVRPLEAALAPLLNQTPRETVVRIPRPRKGTTV